MKLPIAETFISRRIRSQENGCMFIKALHSPPNKRPFNDDLCKIQIFLLESKFLARRVGFSLDVANS